MIFRQLFISLFSVALAFADTSPQTLQKVVDEKIVSIASEKKLPGFALTIVQGGKVICTKLSGVTSLKTKKPITEKTIFQLGSVSKTYTSTLVGVLLEKEGISLSDKITNVLDSLSFPEGIEVKHVLSHTTGFPKYGFNALIESEKKNFSEIAEQLSKTPLVSDPGEKYDYHNVAYSLIDPYIVKKTGETFETNFKKHGIDT
jgi:beta-lactamase class C